MELAPTASKLPTNADSDATGSSLQSALFELNLIAILPAKASRPTKTTTGMRGGNDGNGASTVAVGKTTSGSRLAGSWLAAVTLTLMLANCGLCQPPNPVLAGDTELSLGFGLGAPSMTHHNNHLSSSASQQQQQHLLPPTASPGGSGNNHLQRQLESLRRLMDDELTRQEFGQTEAALQFVGERLEEFARAEGLDASRAGGGRLVRDWLGQNQLNPLSESMVHQLDLIYATFWSQFRPAIESLLRREAGDGARLGDELAFRCQRYHELAALHQLASASTLYRLLLDIFNTDLYVHCLKRKLAMVKLRRIEPSSILRQFVDIYLNFPSHLSRLQLQWGDQLDADTDKSIWATKATLALHFNLQESLARNGRLEQAASLVFGTGFALSFGGRLGADTSKLIDEFKRDCHEHVEQLGQVWGRMDEVAHLLSSDMNNLAEFNAKIKLAAPPLVYGSICGQLAQTVQ